MARRYYRRYRRYRRTYYRRKKWTAYNSETSVNTTVNGANLSANYYKEVISYCVFGSSNSLQNNASASQPISAINYYCCRCRYKGVFNANIPAGNAYIVYIAFVPNAVTINENAQESTGLANSFFYKHPEFVLAWTRIDYIADTGDTGEVSLYSRITKRLSPGDGIVVGVLARNASAQQAALASVQGTFSCYLRTN